MAASALTQEVAVKAYKAALNDDWEAIKGLYQSNKEEAVKPLTVTNDNVLHIAVYSGSKSPVEELLEIVPVECVGEINDIGNTPLHEAAVIGNLEAARVLVRKSAAELDARNALGETPLFRSAAFGVKEMVKYLASELGQIRVPFDVIQSTRKDKTSLLHIAAIGHHFETALWLLENDKTLGDLKDQSGRTCLHLLARMPGAFKSGCPMGKLADLIYFYLPCINEDEDEAQEPNSKNNDPDLERSYEPGAGNDHRQYHCHSYFRRALSGIHFKFWQCLAKGWPPIDRIWKTKRKHELAVKLVKMLVPTDVSWVETHAAPDLGIVDLGAGHQEPKNYYSSRINENKAREGRESEVTRVATPTTPLLLATSTGIVEIVEEILEQYPHAIHYVTEKDQNIMHIAIRYRRKQIFSLVKKMRIPMARLVRMVDKDGNTLLHHVADTSNYGGTQSNPVLQLQEELQWFESVGEIIPTHYELHHNAEDKEAQESFEESHKPLLCEAQSWLKRTAESCSLITVLIATAAFTAAYTVPGGSNEKTGLPLLLHNPLFLLFTVMNVLSLVTSLTSVVLFISILTSPFRLKDFRYSLPRKLTFAFTFLFLSVALMMIAFAVTVLLLVHMKKRWSMLVVYAVAFVPVTVFTLLQFPLYASFVGSLRESLGIMRMLLSRRPPSYFST